MPPARPLAPPGLPLGRGHDGIDDFDDPVQGRVRADGHVRPAEVVVDGAHHAHDVEVPVLLHLLLVDLACGGHRHTPHHWEQPVDPGAREGETGWPCVQKPTTPNTFSIYCSVFSELSTT